MSLSKLKLAIVATLLYIRTANAASSDDKAVQENSSKLYSYVVTFDKNGSSIASADAARSLITGYRQLDAAIFGHSNSIVVHILSILTRMAAIELIINGNHEIGGHGARVRDFGLKVAKYEVGFSGGATIFYANHDFPIHKRIAIAIGGMQANYLLSENIKDSYMGSHSINPIDGMGYLAARLDQSHYIFATKFNDKDIAGNDICSYFKDSNSLYGNSYITKNKLVVCAYLDLLDPFLFYSAYSCIMNRNLDKIPMIDFGGVSYLPAARAILAPYGLGFGLVNHFVIDNRYIQLNLNYGNNPKSNAYGVGVKANNLVKLDSIALGLEAAYWSQPDILTNRPLQEKCKQGGFGAVSFKFNLNETFKIVGSVGYKTAGFIEGMPLESSSIIRTGLNVEVKT